VNASAADIKTRLMVGLEVHVELATRSKMFTAAPNVAHPDNFDAGPNSLCDPVVVGMPGVLPVINKRAVEMAMMVGLALGCKIARFTKWDRKSYYYPDLPKNYQISQYDLPLCYDGAVELPGAAAGPGEGGGKTIRVLRAHLEEDAGKLLHEAPGGGAIDYSIVDLNRAGTPLLEIVTQPDFETAEQVVAFAQMLRNLCRTLGVTEGIMQRGHMRFEPNINVVIESAGATYRTPIVEIKNLNSFKALFGSVQYEYGRQIEQWRQTGQVMAAGAKSTRGWDDVRQETFLQREKEDAHDYRYFPDPDLVPVVVSDAWLEAVRAQLPELPAAKEQRLIERLGLEAKQAKALVEEPALCGFFEAVVARGVEGKRAAAILMNNLARRANQQHGAVTDLGITPRQVGAIEAMVAGGKISATAADDLYGLCCENPQADPEALAKENGLIQVSDDGALSAWVEQAVAANPKAADAVKGGKDAAIGALVGAVMKLSKGQANPKRINDMIRMKLRS
jgi:aspartyl-tRNA(Asn)/glutamyl-tRNA(Gln) amidotransferase subunit B